MNILNRHLSTYEYVILNRQSFYNLSYVKLLGLYQDSRLIGQIGFEFFATTYIICFDGIMALQYLQEHVHINRQIDNQTDRQEEWDKVNLATWMRYFRQLKKTPAVVDGAFYQQHQHNVYSFYFVTRLNYGLSNKYVSEDI